jgi:dihydroneopterin aldolase
MVTIELQKLRLRAFHGLYEGEEKVGSLYEVNVKVMYEEGNNTFDSLENTVNYVRVFEIVQQRMKMPMPLLEKVANGIIHAIQQQYPFVREIGVSLYKLEAPIENFQGKLGVSIRKEFHG